MKISPYICLALAPFIGGGCVTHSLDKAIQSMPGYEFGEFSYNSSTNATKTSVIATNAKIEDNSLIVESLMVDHHNTFFNVSASVKELKRPLSATARLGELEKE